MTRHEAREEVRVGAAGQIVARGDRAERARVVVEAGGLVDPRGLRGVLSKAPHALQGVVKPPGRAEAHGGIMPGEGRQLPAVGGLVEREDHERESRIVAVRVQQGSEVARELGRDRDVSASIGAELLEQRAVVIPQRARVNLHHQPILEG